MNDWWAFSSLSSRESLPLQSTTTAQSSAVLVVRAEHTQFTHLHNMISSLTIRIDAECAGQRRKKIANRFHRWPHHCRNTHYGSLMRTELAESCSQRTQRVFARGAHWRLSSSVEHTHGEQKSLIRKSKRECIETATIPKFAVSVRQVQGMEIINRIIRNESRAIRRSFVLCEWCGVCQWTAILSDRFDSVNSVALEWYRFER